MFVPRRLIGMAFRAAAAPSSARPVIAVSAPGHAGLCEGIAPLRLRSSTAAAFTPSAQAAVPSIVSRFGMLAVAPRSLTGGGGGGPPLRPGAAVRLASAGSTGRPPDIVLVKLGDVTKYVEFTLSWEKLALMDNIALLKALKAGDDFGPLLQGVALAACRVYVLRDALAPGKVAPDAADETPDKLFELKGIMTLADAAKEAGCTSAVLCVRVTLPQAAAAPAEAPALNVPSVLLPDDPLVRVVAAIREKKVKVTDAGHLLLPDGLAWPCATNSLLYVRKFYAPLFDSVLEGCRPEKTSWYVIYRLLSEHPQRTIMYASNEDKSITVIPPAGRPIYEVGIESAWCLQHRVEKDTVLIADSILPPVMPFPTLIISSPRHLAARSLRDELNSYYKPRIFMPVPTEEEVLDMRRVAFSHVDEAGVRKRMALWGPIPRNVLVEVSPEEQSAALAAVLDVPMHELVRAAQGFEREDGSRLGLDVPHRMLQERAAGQDAPPGTDAADIHKLAYYLRGRVVISSPPFLRYVAERITKTKAWNAAFLIDASLGNGALGALHGLKFEDLVLSLLQEGQSFKCRDLDERVEKHINFLNNPRLTWKDTSDLQTIAHRTAGHLLVPKDRNAAGLDALVWDPDAGHHWPVASTVAARDGVHADGLADAVTALGWTPETGWPSKPGQEGSSSKLIKYYWFIPEDRYQNRWTSPQSIKAKSGVTALACAAFAHTEQYAVAVPSAVIIKRVAAACKSQGVQLPKDFEGGVSDIK